MAVQIQGGWLFVEEGPTTFLMGLQRLQHSDSNVSCHLAAVKVTMENKLQADGPRNPLAQQRVLLATNPVRLQTDILIAPWQVLWEVVISSE